MGTPLASGSPGPSAPELDRLRAHVARFFPVYETRVGPQSVTFVVHADRATMESSFRTLADELWPEFYVPFLRTQTGEYLIEVGRRPAIGPSRIWVNAALLAATVLSTIFVGALIWASFVGGTSLTGDDLLYGALYFALPLMAILGCHELAHYVVARRYHLDASLPYFIPAPPPLLFGTLGAFISIRQPFTDRKALFDIGVAGPLAGFAVAIPVTVFGIFLSVTGPAQSLAACGPVFLGTSYSSLIIGVPAIWEVFTLFFPSGLTNLHPLALAGWVGILITAINLLPAGQLDGGHVWRGLLGDRTRYLSYAIAVFLLVIGLFFYFGWLVFAFLVIFTGLRHPPPLNDVSPIGWRRGLVGLGVAAILIGGFVLVPVAAQTGQLGTSSVSTTVLHPPPGYAIAGNLSVNVQNGDPVPHAVVFTASVSAVYLNNSSTPLNDSARTTWASTSSWTVSLGGSEYTVSGSANVTAPGGSGFFTLNGSASVPVLISYENTQSAYAVFVTLQASEVCPPPGSGPATVTFPQIT